ncbi:MAG TPA: hypothetical protein VK753_12645 [Xanthomonadaceae bacterium]|jgi:hypothetical protein|nr:hypothetical protein [Xanthomonadaceae bacterium]
MKFPRVNWLPWIAGVCMACVLVWPACAGFGSDFGTRDPALCPIRDAPRTGAPSVQLAAHYFACDTERVGDLGASMYLVSEVRLKVAPKGRAYDAKSDMIASGIDPGQSVYDIRGDFRLYQCSRKDSPDWLADPGHACRYQNFLNLQGLCWKDLSSDWHCGLPYKFDIEHTVHSVAPPR